MNFDYIYFANIFIKYIKNEIKRNNKIKQSEI